MGGFGLLGAPLGRSGMFFCGPGLQKERPEVSKRPYWWHRANTDIPMCFLCFMKLAGPNGGPNDGLEAFLDHLGAHGANLGHMGATFGTCGRQSGSKCWLSAVLECEK